MVRYTPSAQSGSDPRIEQAFSEVFKNTPRTVTATGKTGAAKGKMMAAIALSKAKAAGANVPEKG
jgi:hypothetical protein